MQSIDLVAIFIRIRTILLRRLDLLIIPLLIILPLSLIGYKLTPRTYKSFTKILFEEAALSNPFLQKFTTATRLKKRINLLINIVMSHRNLGLLVDKIAKDGGEELTPLERHYRIIDLRNKITIMYLGQGLVQLEFLCRNPKNCLDRLTFLLKRFQKETLHPQKEAVQRSSKFLSFQIARMKHQLKDTELKLMNYKRKHSLELPKTFQVNLTTYLFLRKQYTQNQVKLAAAKQRRDFLYARIRVHDPTLYKLKRREAAASRDLSRLRSKYTSKHPSVRAAMARYAKAKAVSRAYRPKNKLSLAKLQNSMKWGVAGKEMYKDPLSGRIRSGKASALERLQETILKISVLEKQIQKNQAQLGQFKKRLSSYPMRERKLMELTQEAKIARELYTNLRTMYEQSLIRRELAVFDASRRVQVIEPAVLPLFPIRPRLVMFVGGGIAAALALAGLLIGLAELTDQTIRVEEESGQSLGIEVLGNIKKLPPLH